MNHCLHKTGCVQFITYLYNRTSHEVFYMSYLFLLFSPVCYATHPYYCLRLSLPTHSCVVTLLPLQVRSHHKTLVFPFCSSFLSDLRDHESRCICSSSNSCEFGYVNGLSTNKHRKFPSHYFRF